MPRAVLAIALALLAAMLALWLWNTPAPPNAGGAPPNGPPARPVAPSTQVPAEVAKPATVSDRTLAEPGAQASLRCMVVRAVDGSPIAGAGLEVDGDFVLVRRESVQSDRKGQAAFAFAGPSDVRSVRVHATSTSPDQLWSGSLRIASGASEELRIEVGAGGSVRGRVLDTAGQAVAGAEVLAWLGDRPPHRQDGVLVPEPDRRTTSDAAGAFAITGIGDHFELEAIAGERWGLERKKGRLAGRPVVDGVDVVVAPAVLMPGVLLDGRRQPIADHPVGACSGGEVRSAQIPDVELEEPVEVHTRSDADGRFTLRAIAGYAESWEVQHPEHPMFRVRHRPADGPLEIVLADGVSVHGLVSLPDGRPAVGAEVVLNDYPRRKARCDVDGRFTLRGAEPLTAKSYLRVSHPQAAIHCVQPVTDQGDVLVRLEPPQPLAGVVRMTSGAPAAGARVAITGERRVEPGFTFGGVPTWEWAHDCDEVRADAAGRFQFGRLYPGRFAVRVQAPITGTLSLRTEAWSGRTDLEFVLDPAAMRAVVFTGRVVDDVTGGPLAQFIVTPLHHEGGSWSGHNVPVTSADGTFELVGYEPGDWSLTVACDGRATYEGPVQHCDAGEHRFDVRLLPQRSFLLRVRDSSGAPVSGLVKVRDLAGNDLWIQEGRSRQSGVYLKRGEVPLAGLPAAQVVFAIAVQDGPVSEQTVDLRRFDGKDLTLTVDKVEPPLELDLVFLGAKDVERAKEPADKEEFDKLVDQGSLWSIRADVDVQALDAAGHEVASASAKVIDDPDAARKGLVRYKTTARTSSMSQSSESGPTVTISMRLSVPARAMALVVRAAGHRERRLPVPTVKTEGRPFFVWLARE